MSDSEPDDGAARADFPMPLVKKHSDGSKGCAFPAKLKPLRNIVRREYRALCAASMQHAAPVIDPQTDVRRLPVTNIMDRMGAVHRRADGLKISAGDNDPSGLPYGVPYAVDGAGKCAGLKLEAMEDIEADAKNIKVSVSTAGHCCAAVAAVHSLLLTVQENFEVMYELHSLLVACPNAGALRTRHPRHTPVYGVHAQ